MPSPEKPNSHVIMVMNGPEDGRVFEINKERLSIGAGDEDDIIIRSDPSLNNFPHALLVRQNNQFRLIKHSPPSDNSDLIIQPGRRFTIGQTELLIKLKYQV